ncbi:MAG TPA: CHAT domain-containing tetratricopeptide repeat protein [Pyrinomonadaceae bacterium]|nr:CHAT domain-containing tetratricopeptide repeat protein [Pyrinomonadaceae bacterium]
MKRSTLAIRLIRETREAGRKKLLKANLDLADAALARELKDFCYRVWTSQPAETRKASAALRTLSELCPDKETDAVRRWVDGIADITAGKLELAVTNLDSASRLLSRLGREHESAQPLVAKLIALAMLGKYRAAEHTGQKALGIFSKYRDQLAAGKIEMNLSNIVSRRDEYKLAERYCLSAHRRFKKLGERAWQTMAENGLANTYAELNDFGRAGEFYAKALANARGLRMHVTVAEIEASMGNLALFRGHFAEAIKLLERSRQKYEKLGMPHQTAVADLEIADIYGELNLTSEAAEIYRRVIPTLHRLKMRAEEARARANFGRALTAAENFGSARTEFKRAAELFERERNRIASTAVRLRLSSLELSLGRYSEALAIVESSAPALDQTDNVRLKLSGGWLQGEILSKMARYDEAEKLLRKTFKESSKLEQPTIARSALNSLGVIAYETGKFKKAETLFESAIQAAEAARAPLPGEEFQMAFLAKSLEPYENLTRLYLGQGDFENALISVERARSRTLLDAVGAEKALRKNDGSTKLREELNWFYSRLARAENEEIRGLQSNIRDRERKLSAHSLRAQSSSRAKAGQKGASRLDLVSLRRQLGEEKALIEFVEHRGRYSIFAVTNNRIDFVNAVASETEILSLLEGLHFQFGSLRFGGLGIAAFTEQLKARADTYLEKLYDKLLRPITGSMQGRNLVVVPAGALHYVPFHALSDGKKYVVENSEVSYAPSAGVWARLNSKKPRPFANSLLMAFADEKIPLVNDEVVQLAKILPGPTRFSGKHATFASFQKNAPNFDLIHLACHGQFRPDNPMFSSLHLSDGWVTVRDVYANHLDAQLVTLSACETGLNKIAAGAEILGLARGFLSAGARSLLLSLWTVNDEATANLMGEFYSNLQRGASVSASLRIAQKGFIDRGQHPYYWSPFFVIG